MNVDKNDIEIFPSQLKKNKYSFCYDTKYIYISVDSLNPQKRNQIIDIVKDNNCIPKNFLEFILEVCLYKLDKIYNSEIIDSKILDDYEERNFGLIIKINECEKTEQQLVLYSLKSQELFDQFSLINCLTDAKYQVKINNENDETKISFIKADKIENYTRREDSELEIYNYFKKKITHYQKNLELPDVFYTFEDNFVSDNNSELFSYSEFFSVYLVKHRVKFDTKLIPKFLYENSDNEISFEEDPVTFEIKKGNLVFIETDINLEFSENIENLIGKINKFRSLYDHIYGTENFGIVICYLYQDYDAFYFKRTIEDAIRNCINKNMKGVDKYTICSFYMNNDYYTDSSDETAYFYSPEDDTTFQLLENEEQSQTEKIDNPDELNKKESFSIEKKPKIINNETSFANNEIKNIKNEICLINNEIEVIKKEINLMRNGIQELKNCAKQMDENLQKNEIKKFNHHNKHKKLNKILQMFRMILIIIIFLLMMLVVNLDL